jgi:thymidylate synthase (FAD)
MRIVKPRFAIEYMPENVMEHLESCTRTCYRSVDKIGKGTADRLIASVIKRGHESVIEHACVTVRFVCDRGVSHELVRHRLAAFSQESTRYVRYDGSTETREVAFVIPCFFQEKTIEKLEWIRAVSNAERSYLALLDYGYPPEQARSVLPNSLRTEIVVTANLREWRHILKLRTSKDAHPQMRELMIPLGHKLAQLLPVIFGEFK